MWLSWSEGAEAWLCDRMEGSWAPNASIFWILGDHRQEVRVIGIETGKVLSFRWSVYGTQPETAVEVRFHPRDEEVGLKNREREWPLTKENVAYALDHACGWENLLCRWKAWVEAGIKLR